MEDLQVITKDDNHRLELRKKIRKIIIIRIRIEGIWYWCPILKKKKKKEIRLNGK
jgi:hypothetical protein